MIMVVIVVRMTMIMAVMLVAVLAVDVGVVMVVGDQVGGDHRLAVARPGGVEHAIEKGDAEQGPGRAAVGLGGADRAGQRAIELSLFGKYPTEHPADRGRRRALRTRHAERAALRPCRVDGAGHQQDDRHREDELRKPRRAPGHDLHGHFTEILLAYSAPMVSDGSLWSGPSWLRRCDSAAPISCGRPTVSLHCAGAPTSFAGSFSLKLKSTKNSRSKISRLRSFAFTGVFNGSTKCSVSTVSFLSKSR